MGKENFVVEKSKRVFVPASAKHKAYSRMDPRFKKVEEPKSTYGELPSLSALRSGLKEMFYDSGSAVFQYRVGKAKEALNLKDFYVDGKTDKIRLERMVEVTSETTHIFDRLGSFDGKGKLTIHCGNVIGGKVRAVYESVKLILRISSKYKESLAHEYGHFLWWESLFGDTYRKMGGNIPETTLSNMQRVQQVIGKEMTADQAGILKFFKETESYQSSLEIMMRFTVKSPEELSRYLNEYVDDYIKIGNEQPTQQKEYYRELMYGLNDWYARKIETNPYWTRYSPKQKAYILRQEEVFARAINNYVSESWTKPGFEYGGFPEGEAEYKQIISEWVEKYVKTGIIKSMPIEFLGKAIPQTAARLVIIEVDSRPYGAWAAFPVKTRPIRSRGSQTPEEAKQEDELDEKVAEQMDETWDRIDHAVVEKAQVQVRPYQRKGKPVSGYVRAIGPKPKTKFQKKFARLVSFEGRSVWQFPGKYSATGKEVEIPKDIRIGQGEAPTPEEFSKLLGASVAGRSELGYVHIQELVDLTGLPKDRVHKILIGFVRNGEANLSVDRLGNAVAVKVKMNAEPQRAEVATAPWLKPGFTQAAIEEGKKLSREEAIKIWNGRNAVPWDETIEEALHKQYIREMIEGHLGSEEAMTPEQIDVALGIAVDIPVRSSLQNPIEPPRSLADLKARYNFKEVVLLAQYDEQEVAAYLGSEFERMAGKMEVDGEGVLTLQVASIDDKQAAMAMYLPWAATMVIDRRFDHTLAHEYAHYIYDRKMEELYPVREINELLVGYPGGAEVIDRRVRLSLYNLDMVATDMIKLPSGSYKEIQVTTGGLQNEAVKSRGELLQQGFDNYVDKIKEKATTPKSKAFVELMGSLGKFYSDNAVKFDALEWWGNPPFRRGGDDPLTYKIKELRYMLEPTEIFARAVEWYVSGVHLAHFAPMELDDEYHRIVLEWGDKYLKTGIVKSFVILEKAVEEVSKADVHVKAHRSKTKAGKLTWVSAYHSQRKESEQFKKPSVSAEKLVGADFWTFLPKETQEVLQRAYDTDAQIWEGLTIGQHTQMVVNQFEKYFYSHTTALKSSVSFKLFLALHDVGKAIAIQYEGNKKRQSEFARSAVTGVFTKLLETKYKDKGDDFKKEVERQSKIFGALAEQDIIGEYLTKKNAGPVFTAQKILDVAEKEGVPVLDFFALAKLYFMCDAGSYTEDAGGHESLDYLFTFHKKGIVKEGGSTKIYDRDSMEFSRATKQRMQMLEDELRKLDSASGDYTVAFHGTSGEYLKDIIERGLISKKYHNFNTDLYSGPREKSVFVTTNINDADYFALTAGNRAGLNLGRENYPVILKLKIPKEYFNSMATSDKEWNPVSAFLLPEVRPEWIEKVGRHPYFLGQEDLEDIVSNEAVTHPEFKIGTTAQKNEKIFDIILEPVWERVKKADEDFIVVYLPTTMKNWLGWQEQISK